MTAHDVEVHEDVRRDIFYFDDVCGRWSITIEADFSDASILGGRLETESGRLNEADTRRVFALARSEVWRLNNMQRRIPLFMTLRGATAARHREIAEDREVILTVEELAELARRLTLEEKALKTLENLITAEGEIGAGVGIPYLLRDYPGRPDWPKGKPPNEVGISYGCTEIEAPMAYQFLIDGGFVIVRPPSSQQSPSQAFITPKGYAKVQELKTGATTTVLQAFFVCRFIPQLDDLFGHVFHQPIGAELGCVIRRIKDIHHIDKIDDRICEEIRRSRVVLVDLTEQNFNVAFEAGYALALNKPIVWMKRKEAGEAVMPFDIYTYNCLQWEADKLDEFKEALRFRILAALQKAERIKAS